MAVLSLEYQNRILTIPFTGAPILGELLAQQGIQGFSPCGGMGKCGKCAVVLKGSVSAPSQAELNFGTRLACQARLLGDAYAKINPHNDFAHIQSDIKDFAVTEKADFAYGLAIDIGTTTVAGKLFDANGNCLATQGTLNPQISVSADVLGRLSAALKGNAAVLQQQIEECIEQLILNLCHSANITKTEINSTVITGNTAMLYLLQGIDVSSIATYPFAPKALFGTTVTSPIKAYLPSCINAFVGADITCGIIAAGMLNQTKTALLCDIGTNGELALYKNGILYVTSAAAGPAFECANISCGCGYIEGAIESVAVKDGGIIAKTVGDKPALGICGSGLIDAVAAFVKAGYIDSDGNCSSSLRLSANGGTVYINQDDIRALQLAKSAVASAIELLLNKTNTTPEEIDKLYLAGGFGNGININSAAEIGIIPKKLAQKAVYAGNTALNGASQMLFNKNFGAEVKKTISTAKHINLGGTEEFNQAFIKNMAF